MADSPTFDPLPIARDFFRWFLNDKRDDAKTFLYSQTKNEEQRFAVIVEALRLSSGSLALSTWILGWHKEDTSSPAPTTYKDAHGFFREDRRGFREGRAFCVDDAVLIDGHDHGRITYIPPSGKGLHVSVDGYRHTRFVRRHQITLIP